MHSLLAARALSARGNVTLICPYEVIRIVWPYLPHAQPNRAVRRRLVSQRREGAAVEARIGVARVGGRFVELLEAPRVRLQVLAVFGVDGVHLGEGWRVVSRAPSGE